MNKRKLQIEQLESRIHLFSATTQLPNPPTGWVRAIRLALGMTLRQLAKKMSITKQSVQDLERREKDGAITLAKLQKAANALDMELVYGFVPKDGSLELYIDRKAKALATDIVNRTSNTMLLEDQAVTYKRTQTAIEERTAKIKREMPKALWD